MNDFCIIKGKDFVKVETGYGDVKLCLGRPATVEDSKALGTILNLGGRLYADQIKQARRKVDDLIDWKVT